jgi:hypothetical protein
MTKLDSYLTIEDAAEYLGVSPRPGGICEKKSRNGIMAAIMRCEGIGARPANYIDKPFAEAFSQAIDQAGIRPSQKSRKISDFVLQDLIMEGPNFQDWAAQHTKLEETGDSSPSRRRYFETGFIKPCISCCI